MEVCRISTKVLFFRCQDYVLLWLPGNTALSNERSVSNLRGEREAFIPPAEIMEQHFHVFYPPGKILTRNRSKDNKLINRYFWHSG